MNGPRILLVVGGGIAAYKSCELIRLIRKGGGEVTCVLTDGGAQFVTAMALAALSENPVHTSLWDLRNEVEMGHIQLSRAADLVVVCPATADLLAKMAAGIADDLATTLLLATDKPVMAVPAMNVRMWQHAATVRNVERLRQSGVLIVEPAEGAMACGEFGPGRLPEPIDVWYQIAAVLGVDPGEMPQLPLEHAGYELPVPAVGMDTPAAFAELPPASKEAEGRAAGADRQAHRDADSGGGGDETPEEGAGLGLGGLSASLIARGRKKAAKLIDEWRGMPPEGESPDAGPFAAYDTGGDNAQDGSGHDAPDGDAAPAATFAHDPDLPDYREIPDDMLPPVDEDPPPPLNMDSPLLSRKGKARGAPPTDPSAINHLVSGEAGAPPPEPYVPQSAPDAGAEADGADILDGQPDFVEEPEHRPLYGKHVLVTAGPTFEPIDPVRYIANRSSGKQGFAIAAAAAALGARVTLVAGPVHLATPPGVDRIDIETAREMTEAVKASLPADAAIMVAAVADWRTDSVAQEKLKKRGSAPPALLLTENPDILATVASGRQRPKLLVGFAAETENVLEYAGEKRKRKGADWIIANDVSGPSGQSVMGGETNTVHIVSAAGVEHLPEMPKDDVARALMERIADELAR